MENTKIETNLELLDLIHQALNEYKAKHAATFTMTIDGDGKTGELFINFADEVSFALRSVDIEQVDANEVDRQLEWSDLGSERQDEYVALARKQIGDKPGPKEALRVAQELYKNPNK